MNSWRCPAQIAGLVVAVVIDAIERAAVRLWAEVGLNPGDVDRRIMPLGADLDPPATVILKRLMVRILAASDHSLPSAIQRMEGQSMLPRRIGT